ncbi:hypothetical protein C2S51_008213 [Perilla frutescens var. frutescens]|nr:hypothetical protein C2S51_008213 [Perilla frutescens var. frutescens]
METSSIASAAQTSESETVNIHNDSREKDIDVDQLKESFGSIKSPRSLGPMDKFANPISLEACLGSGKSKLWEQNIKDALDKQSSVASWSSSAMADGTRLKDLQEGQNKLHQIWQTETMKRDAAELKIQENMENMQGRMEDIQQGTGEGESILGPTPQHYMGDGSQSKTQYANRGRAWAEPGENQMIPNLPDDQKVTLAAMNFEGKASIWFQNFCSKYGDVNWEQFMEVVAARFGDIKESQVVVEFNKLKHTGDYLDYVDKFEELKECLLMCSIGSYTEAYFVASFLSGLSEELRAAISMFNPTTLQQAIDLGKNQLVTLEAITKSLKGENRPTSNWSNTGAKLQSYQNPSTLTKEPQIAKKPMLPPNSLYDYVRGIGDSLSPTSHQYGRGTETRNSLGGNPSVTAYIKRGGTITTLKFTEVCNGQTLQILVDTGSTLSFIKKSTSQMLGCKVEAVTPLLIKVANGQRLFSSSRVGNFGWQMQGVELQHSLRLLQHEDCDVILGGDWLKARSPIELDYELITVTIRWMGKKLKLYANKT